MKTFDMQVNKYETGRNLISIEDFLDDTSLSHILEIRPVIRHTCKRHKTIIPDMRIISSYKIYQ